MSAANWLNRHAGHQAVLVVPGAPFGQYLWGSPLDDVLQPLTSADWAERDMSIIGSPGNERLLDAIDQRLAAGDGSVGLTALLARMGVRYVVVRDDLGRAMLAGTWPARVNQALASSPGITKVFQSGQFVGTLAPDDAVTNVDPAYPAVVMYRVAGAAPVATVQPAAGTLRVYGGRSPCSRSPTRACSAAGQCCSTPTRPACPRQLGGDRLAAAPGAELRRAAEVLFTDADGRSAGPTCEAIGDYTEPGWSRYLSVAQYRGS